ncbi:phosphatase PAP2 family protein [Phreatobacter sp.]|uniref:phosphatase PAP2 family protein n=1 Tax=Phreatobacter sp. TaxID=1966341 RepID=UPI003F70955C
MTGLAAHVTSLWGRWWIAPFLPALYVLALVPAGMVRPEHVVIAGAVMALGLWPQTKGLVAALYPGIFVAILTDAMRFVVPLFVTAGRVHGCDLRALDLALFAVATDTTPGDWLQRHISPFWDVVFAIPYAAFLYVVPLYALYLFFRDRERMSFYLWAFAVAHLIGYALWLIVPAAPPWYIRANGCLIDLAAAPSAAGLLRVDQLLGITYFHQFYGRAANVFGAMPSMHVVFPLIGLLTAWRSIGWRTRPVHILYASAMMVASVYLDHHWIVDGLAGVVVAVAAVAITARLLKRPWP